MAARRTSVADAVSCFHAASSAVVAWAGTQEDLQAPSRLPGWTVRDILAHLALSAERLATASVSRERPIDLAEYVAGYAPAREEIARQPESLSGDPLPALKAAAVRVGQRWQEETAAPAVEFPRGVLSLPDAIASRVLELVVHGDDLGVTAPRPALALAVRTLAGVLAARHPGRAVEVRIPPLAAVQILAGTVHRRGTPTAVVSMEPLVWIRVATGRTAWADAVAAGDVQASGERSDLGALLPLLA